MRPSCIISIFLCVAFSIKAGARTEGGEIRADASECATAQARRDSLRLEAVRFERAAFEAYDPMEASLALVSKAEVLREAGLPEQAEEALGRVRMYALDDAQRRDVLVLKALCAYDRADYEAALVALNQAGVEVSYSDPKLKSPWAGMFLTFLVPAGFAYAGEPLEGLASTVLNGGAVLWTVTQILGECYVSGIFGGALALNFTFMGAQARVASLIEERNSNTLSEARRTAIADALGL